MLLTYCGRQFGPWISFEDHGKNVCLQRTGKVFKSFTQSYMIIFASKKCHAVYVWINGETRLGWKQVDCSKGQYSTQKSVFEKRRHHVSTGTAKNGQI